MELKKYNVHVRRFDPTGSTNHSEVIALPVDSPDEEHAVSAAMSNAVAFTKKTEGSGVLPVAFSCVRVESRTE